MKIGTQALSLGFAKLGGIMKTIIVAFSLLLLAACAYANPYEIVSIKTAQQDVYVNNAWKNSQPCLEVTLRVKEDIGATSPTIKGYFYNKERECVLECGPTHISLRGQGTYQAPSSYKPGKKYNVYFGIPEKISRGKGKWKNLIVVFGDKQQIDAALHPKGEMEGFLFKEKNLLKKDAPATAPK